MIWFNSYQIYMYKEHLALKNQQLLICHKIQLKQFIYIYYICINRLIGLVSRVPTNGPGNQGSIPGRVKDFKIVFDTSLFNTQQYVSRVKWSNPGKGEAPFPTPRCTSYWKWSLLVALNYGRQLYLYMYKENLALNNLQWLIWHKTKTKVNITLDYDV